MNILKLIFICIGVMSCINSVYAIPPNIKGVWNISAQGYEYDFIQNSQTNSDVNPPIFRKGKTAAIVIKNQQSYSFAGYIDAGEEKYFLTEAMMNDNSYIMQVFDNYDNHRMFIQGKIITPAMQITGVLNSYDQLGVFGNNTKRSIGSDYFAGKRVSQ